MLRFALLFVVVTQCVAAGNPDPSLTRTLVSIRADAIRSHLEFLADDTSQPIQYENSARFARFAALTTYSIANDPKDPAWNANDFFGKRFAYR